MIDLIRLRQLSDRLVTLWRRTVRRRNASDEEQRGKAFLQKVAAASARWSMAAVLAGVAETTAGLLFAAGLALAVATIASGEPDLVLPLTLAATGVIGRGVAAWARERASFEAGAEARTFARTQVAQAITSAGPAYAEHHETGALSSALIDQVEALEGYAARYRPQVVITAIAPMLVLAAVAITSWPVAAIFLLTAPMLIVGMAIVGSAARAAAEEQFAELARLAGRFNDRLSGLATLKAFNATAHEQANLESTAERFRQRTMKVLRLAFLSSAVLELFASVAIAATALYVGLSLMDRAPFGLGQEITLWAGVFVLLLAPEFFAPLRRLAGAYHDRQNAAAAAEELAGILADAPPARAPGRSQLTETPPSIMFAGVHARYLDGRAGLAGLSFHAPAGQVTALAGASGSGKSTAIKVLLGFIEPENGLVQVGGVDWREGPGFTRHSAWVGQNPRLFHGSITDNIRLGAPDADEERINAAATSAGVNVFAADLPEGLDTHIGERNFGLSGGQAQRVALARALIKDAPLLLLDEPTAGLDGETEAMFLEVLAVAGRGRTILIATHSPAVLAFADHVVHMAEGREVAP